MAINIFDHFIPITWTMGHMGTFLQNFLTRGAPYQIPFSVAEGMKDNKEWMFTDALDNFFGSPIDKFAHIYDSLSSTYSGSELIEKVAIKFFEEKYKSLIKTDEISFEIVKNNSSRYIKEHYSHKHGTDHRVSNVRWTNKKIHCRFPDEYSWIPYFLLKYKFNTPGIHFVKNSDFSLLDNRLRISTDRSFIKVVDNLILDDIVNEEYIQFDIYNLVINKNLDQVYQIDPSFEFNIPKKNMLNTAHTSTLEILKLYGLNPNCKIDRSTTVESVFNMQKLNPKL